MATIALYANKINNMPSLLGDVKSAVNDLKSEFSSLKQKCSQVDPSICNLTDEVNTVSIVTKLQENNVTALQNLQDDIISFANEAAFIDGAVADAIDGNKDDFYDKYYYLKPGCEKNSWEKFCDGCQKANQWCFEHWEALRVAVLAVVITMLCVSMGVLAIGPAIIREMLVIAVVLSVVGALLNAVLSLRSTGSYDFRVTDVIADCIGNLVGSIIGFFANGLVGDASGGAISSLLSDSLNSLFYGEKKTTGEMMVNAFFTAVFDGTLSWIMDKLGKLTKWLLPSSSQSTTAIVDSGNCIEDVSPTQKKDEWNARKEFLSGMRDTVLSTILDSSGGIGALTDWIDSWEYPEWQRKMVSDTYQAKEFHWMMVAWVFNKPVLGLFAFLPTGWMFGDPYSWSGLKTAQ